MALQKIKCATRADVAREANVSETIVSYVMNNNRYVAAEKRKRVLEAAEKLNYSPNNMALALSGKDSKQLLFIVDTPESWSDSEACLVHWINMPMKKDLSLHCVRAEMMSLL